MTLPTGDVMRARTRRHHHWAAALAAALTPALLAGCTGSGSDDPLADAQRTLEETSGVELAVTTEQVPPGADGLLGMKGTATNAPAFDGTLEVRVNDLTEEIPMVAVDGAVHAQLPFTDAFAEIDPADYGAPDPAELMDPGHGIAGWLAATQGAEESDGEVTGQVPGKVVAELFESARARGTFEATYEIDDEQLQRAELTGPFYGRKATTYVVEIEQYDVDEDITRP